MLIGSLFCVPQLQVVKESVHQKFQGGSPVHEPECVTHYHSIDQYLQSSYYVPNSELSASILSQ